MQILGRCLSVEGSRPLAEVVGPHVQWTGTAPRQRPAVPMGSARLPLKSFFKGDIGPHRGYVLGYLGSISGSEFI